MSENVTLLSLLKRHFGFDSFKPLHERSPGRAGGRDVFACC